MRLITIFLLISIFTTSHSFSQFKGGMEVGGNIMGTTEFILEGAEYETENSWGIRLGYAAEYKFNEILFIRGAVLINQRGFQLANERWGVNAIEAPLNLGLNFALNEKGVKWFVDAGLSVEYNSRAFTKINDELVTLSIGNEPGDIKPISMGFNAGTGIQFSEKMKLRLSYYQGLTNLVQTSGDSWSSYVLGTALIFYFPKN